MASVPTLDIDAVLKPISAEKPAGVNIREATSYVSLMEARREDPDSPRGDWELRGGRKVANWPKVVRTATEILTTESKDLQVAAWLVEGLVNRHGFAGLRDGVEVLRRFHAQFWDEMFPLVKDGDDEERSGIIGMLEKKISIDLILWPIIKPQGKTQCTYSLYKESKRLDNLKLMGSKQQEALDNALADGKLDGNGFKKVMAVIPLAHCSNLLEDMSQSQEALTSLNRILEEKYKKDAAPSMGQIGQVISDCLIWMDDTVQSKGGVGLQRSPEDVADETAPLESAGEGGINPHVETGSAGEGGINPYDRIDAIRRLSAIAEFFLRTEPHSPVSYLVQRAARWGGMPLDVWLQEVIKDAQVLAAVRETLGLMMKQESEEKQPQ